MTTGHNINYVRIKQSPFLPHSTELSQSSGAYTTAGHVGTGCFSCAAQGAAVKASLWSPARNSTTMSVAALFMSIAPLVESFWLWRVGELETQFVLPILPHQATKRNSPDEGRLSSIMIDAPPHGLGARAIVTDGGVSSTHARYSG